MSKKGSSESISSKKGSQNTRKKEIAEELGVITAVETDETKEVRKKTRKKEKVVKEYDTKKKETLESGKSKVVETDEEGEEQKTTTSTPSKSPSFFKALLSKSSSRSEKSGTSKVKKVAKMKKKGQEKSQDVMKEQTKKDSLSTGNEHGEGSAKRSMIQTNLSNTKEGTLEVVSSPEQPQLKSQRKKSDKKSRSTPLLEKQSKEKQKKQTRITNIFPVRKSSRKSKTELEKDENAKITKAILSKQEEGLEVCDIEEKGRGVFATRPFNKNEFICEYAGDLISYKEAKKREKTYSDDKDIGCYMYYLEHKNTKYCIDATEENGTLGRLLNHSRSGNCKTKKHIIKNKPHLILVANIDVEKGEELTYDYGERNKEAIESHPWLKS